MPDEAQVVRCECRPWFAGRNCQINLKLLLIVGCVSVILMIVIACGVSCFCCRDRQHGKDSIPCEYSDNAFKPSFFIFSLCTFFIAPYGTSVSRMPVNMGRQHGFMMDPHGGGAVGGGKLKVSILQITTNRSFMFLIPRKYSFTQHANNVNICFSIP